MTKSLVIVESPAKAKTIQKFLGPGYIVESSLGHIRDLPRNAAEVPEKLRKTAWARLGLDVDNDFRPVYVVPAEKRGQVQKLRQLVREADQILLATDEDREGEAIAWHLVDELRPRVPIKRMVFHEITRKAIEEAIAKPRDIDEHLVEAQEARRALDRLYGYEVSPVLWKKVKPQLSAGRVQSVAARMLVERERERMRFVAGAWWDLEATARTEAGAAITAGLVELGGLRVATGKDFDPLTGKLKPDARVALLDEAAARALARDLEGKPLRVLSTEEKPYTLRPYAPFMTSTLQQEANRKLGFGAQRTMRTAQRLYEAGYITYMRTDSTSLSDEALRAARAQVQELYGREYLHPSPRTYDKKVKNAQEAHEAIRPAGSEFRTPESLRRELDEDQFRLYDLIWKRTVASQMADARGRRMQVRMGAAAADGREAVFAASGKAIDFAGFLRAYVEGSDDPEGALEDREIVLPPLREGERLASERVEAKGHETQPPARYTEASLVQALEGAGIGRPSTYASILQTIQDRGYVFKKGQALVPTLTAFATVGLLEKHFSKLVDYGFTAKMEEDLDGIAAGAAQRVPYLRRFYFGDGAPRGRAGGEAEGGLKDQIAERLESIDPREVATIPVPKLEGTGIEVRVGRYGPFLKRGEQSVTIPDDVPPDELTPARCEELLSKQSSERRLGVDPATGQPVFAKDGRYGPYVTLGDPSSDDRSQLKYASLFPSDSLATITLERALQLLSLPRVVGQIDGEDVIAQNGRFGPFLKKGSETRSLASHEQIFTVTLDEARQILAQPKTRRGQATTSVLRTFEYEGRAPIVLKQGRFAPYLSDGEVNASLRSGDGSPSDLTPERALEILAERGKPPKAKARGTSAGGRRAPAARGAKGGGGPGSGGRAGAAKAGATKAAPTKAAKNPSKKGATKAPKTDAERAAARPPWAEVEPFTRDLDPTTARLLGLVNGQGKKLAEAAQSLGIDPKDALARYRASNFKVYSAYRKAKRG
jgi:DNA topoisomerase-1